VFAIAEGEKLTLPREVEYVLRLGSWLPRPRKKGITLLRNGGEFR
jgi:hypothetical protein